MLEWFEDRLTDRGILGKLEWANTGPDANSAYVTLAYAYTLRNVADVWDYIGLTAEAKRYRGLAAKLAKSVYKLCFDEQKQLMADSPEKKRLPRSFSHTGHLPFYLRRVSSSMKLTAIQARKSLYLL